ncbi:MAG TPA: fibronectin type III domain-containing protein [Bacteroidia bacterium]|nr:fibronectin type III domain-containing protein [Bacteroidia bacterium]HNT80673.1 fibronectin type III domain-containing protein [Bacteroidia bacterium]
MKKVLSYLMALAMVLTLSSPSHSQINCPTPGGLFANVSQSFAMLHWGSVPGAAFYEVSYKLSTQGNTWTTDTTVNNFYLAQNLLPGVTYEWRVRTACVNAIGTPIVFSPYSPSQFFTMPGGTGCMAPTNLTSTNVSSTFAVIMWQSVPGAIGYNYRWRKANMNLAWTIGFTNSNNASLSPLSPQTLYEFQVEALCPDTNGTVTGSGFSNSGFFTTQPNANVCSIPQNLHVSNITQTSALLNWSSTGAAQYSIRYRQVGSNTWIYLNSQSNSKMVSGLMPFTQYQWQVRSKCINPNGVVTFSNFSPASIFTTQNSTTFCFAPNNLQAHQITMSSAFLIWSNTGAAQYSLRYRVLGSSNTWTYLNSQTNSKQVNGLSPMTVYEWQVRSKCQVPGSTQFTFSPFSALNVFTTQSNTTLCAVPTNLTSTFQGGGSAVLVWSNTGAAQYSLRIRNINSAPSTWSYLNAQTNMRVVDSLIPLGIYEWQVRSKCINPNGVVLFSNWSVPQIFTMPPAITVYPNPAREFVNIKWESDISIDQQLNVKNIYGTVVLTLNTLSGIGENNVRIHTTELKPGIYFVELRNSRGAQMAKIYVQ